MNNRAMIPWVILAALGMSLGACSTFRGEKSGSEIATTGPTIVDAKAQPGTIELSKSLQPSKPAQVVADVKDFTSKIVDVRLRFVHAPIEIPMQNVGGSTWQATLSPEQLKTLAVGGQTMKYEANVIARNEEGRTAMSREPVNVVVKTPEMSPQTG